MTLILIGGAACASTPDPEPALPAGVVVVPLEKGRLVGGEATWVAEVPRERVVEALLDFESQPAYRPSVLEARSIERGPEGGTVAYRFRGRLGIAARATCVYTIEESEMEWVLAFRMTDPSIALWALEGEFRLRSVRGGGATLVGQRFLVSLLSVNRADLLEELAADAAAIRTYLEGGVVSTRR